MRSSTNSLNQTRWSIRSSMPQNLRVYFEEVGVNSQIVILADSHEVAAAESLVGEVGYLMTSQDKVLCNLNEEDRVTNGEQSFSANFLKLPPDVFIKAK